MTITKKLSKNHNIASYQYIFPKRVMRTTPWLEYLDYKLRKNRIKGFDDFTCWEWDGFDKWLAPTIVKKEKYTAIQNRTKLPEYVVANLREVYEFQRKIAEMQGREWEEKPDSIQHVMFW
jgi:hypothetical protein